MVNNGRMSLYASMIGITMALAGWAYSAGILSSEIKANTKEHERKDAIIVPRTEIDAKLTDITNQMKAIDVKVQGLREEVGDLREQTAEQTTAIIREISRRREMQ